jgi:hypothetical protein
MSRSPTLAEVIRRAMDARFDGLHISLPVQVERYNAEKQLVDVQPLIKFSHEDEEGAKVVEALPVIPSVPVQFPDGGDFIISYPIKTGSTGLLVFCDASLDKWISEGGLVDPGFDHRFALADAFFIPGVRPIKSARQTVPTDGMFLGKDGGNGIHIKEQKVGLGGEPGSPGMEPAALGQTLQTFLNQLVAALSALVLPVSGPSAGPPAPGTIPSAPTVTATKAEVK